MGTKSHKKLFFFSFLSDPDPIIVHPIRKTSLFLRGSAGPCARRLLISSHTNNLVELTSRPFRKLIEWPLLTKIFNRTLTHKLGNMQNMQYYWNCPDIRVTKAPSPIQTRRARPSWAPTSGSSTYDISWKVIDRGAPFTPVTGRFNLCTEEKFYILRKPEMASLNSRQEVSNHCRLIAMFLLSMLKKWKFQESSILPFCIHLLFASW